MIRVTVYKPSDRRYYIARWKDSKGRTRKRSTKQTRRRGAERFAAELEEAEEAKRQRNRPKQIEGFIPLGQLGRLTTIAERLGLGKKTLREMKKAGLETISIMNADFVDTDEFARFLREEWPKRGQATS